METPSQCINHRWMPGVGPRFVSSNPVTSELLWEGREASPQQVDEAVTAAHDATANWAETSLEHRRQCLEEFARLLEDRAEPLSKLISDETGKPHWEARTEVNAMIRKVEITIRAYYERCAETMSSSHGIYSATRYKPHGVVAVLGPFNFPGHLPNGHIVPALLAGNTVVFKPSEQTPAVGQALIEIYIAAGIPRGVLNMVQGGRIVGEALARHPLVRGIFFTGGTATGEALRHLTADQPDKLLALELGGNNPLVVAEVGNFKAAAYLTLESAYITSGQRCSCARRLIVVDGPRADHFISVLQEMIQNVRVSDPAEQPEPFMGSLISATAAQRMLEAQQMLIERGGRTLMEMKTSAGCPAILSPGLIDVTDAEDVPDQEFFGPMLQMYRVADFDSAIKAANNTRYGLVAALLSDDLKQYEAFYRSVRAGVINWNRQTTGANSGLPFGGVGASGNHRPAGYFSVDYCSYPVASIEAQRLEMPAKLSPGIKL